MSELPPAVIFSFSVVYYLIPTGSRLVFGQLPAYVTKGPFWPIMQFVGAIVFTVASVMWVSLLSDEKKNLESMWEDMDNLMSNIDIDEDDFDDITPVTGFDDEEAEEADEADEETNEEAEDDLAVTS